MSGSQNSSKSSSHETSSPVSNNKDDVNTTAAIRRAVVKDHSLSAMAKNVKIITGNGTVTLRGPVKTEAGKAKIAELAQSAAGNAGQITDVSGPPR